jgi:isopentenyldiphosphate isomerase
MEELFDIVTEDDFVVCQATRSTTHARGLWHRGVHVFLFTREGKLLIQKRSAARAQYPSVWDCSVSEHVKAGESYPDAARRGLWEELGLEGVDLCPLVRFRMNYGPNDNEISTLFRGQVEPAWVRFDPVEIERVNYCRPAELRDFMREESLPLSRWFVEMLRWFFDQPSEMNIIETYSRPR